MKNPKLKLKDFYNALNKPLQEQEEEPKDFGNFPSHIPQAGKQVSDPRLNPDSKDESEFKEETVEIEIPGTEGKQEVKIKHKDVMTDEALKGVTITFGHEGDDVEKYTDVDFDAGEMIEDHENEGQDWIFIAEGDDSMTFEVEVQVEAEYENSGQIQQIDWDTLTVIYADKDEPLDENGCTEKEIAEGTCGYAPDGEIDVDNTDELEPASGIVISLAEQFKIRAGIIK